MAYFSFGLGKRLRPLKEDSPLPAWIQGNVEKSSKWIAVAFFAAGTIKDLLLVYVVSQS